MRRSLFGKRYYSHTQKVIKTGIMVIVINILILTGVFFVTGHELGNVIYGDFAYAVNTGGVIDDVEYKSEIIIDNENKDIIDENEWISPKVGEQYGYISCEEIGLDAALYFGDSDAILMKGAGQSTKSVFPGQTGMILVGGHDSTYFEALSKLEDSYSGCVIKVNTIYGSFEYEVTGQEIIKGSDFEVKTDKEQLVLYTCYPFGKITEERTEKIVFYCDKKSGPVIGGGSGNE